MLDLAYDRNHRRPTSIVELIVVMGKESAACIATIPTKKVTESETEAPTEVSNADVNRDLQSNNQIRIQSLAIASITPAPAAHC